MTNKVLAKALNSLKKIQEKEGNVFKHEKLDSKSITLLKEHGYLFPIIKGWYCIQDPSTKKGDTTVWYINAWLFFSKYLTDRFGLDKGGHYIYRWKWTNITVYYECYSCFTWTTMDNHYKR